MKDKAKSKIAGKKAENPSRGTRARSGGTNEKAGLRAKSINSCLQSSDILDAFPFYAMLVDEHHFIIQANKAVLLKLGVHPKDIVGKYCPEVIHGTREPWYACPLEEAVEKNQVVEREALDQKSGRWIRSAIYPIRKSAGGQRVFFHMVTDITDIKQEIEQRTKTEERLTELYDVEKKLRSKLEQQIERRKEFTRALVHELKTPLTPILGASQMLLDNLKDDRLLRMARNINRGAMNLNHSVSNLVDLTRGEMGILELAIKEIDISFLLKEVVDFMMPDAEKKGQKMTLELPDALPVLRADEDRLRQVLLNLLDNAMKFTPRGGKISLRASMAENNLVIEVKDSGCGIARKDQRQLFVPYKRTGKLSSEQLSGLGLGLPLAKMLVELHHGRIHLESEKGLGTVVSLSIPLNSKSEYSKKASGKI
ncbi:MAG: PAS domain-containing sensor histidine kinase [Dehalococcoidia bacterium]|nr:MAG: PAS domain-containing sensor histidine kinase [Dehalococcoidia bacterium]